MSDEAERYRAIRGPKWCAIFDAMRNHRLSNMCFEGSDEGYCLVDALSAEGESIAGGEMQLVELTDEILIALQALE